SEKTKSYEEKQAKRKEIFFNSVLAHDEIDRLFDHKALTNWKRFTKDGEQEVGEIKRDEDGTIKENLIIKGNNLLALHSLKKQFAGKVKLIYIDPPYNTGNDGFKYNDNFNHSTWLTFMKNRLEVARELLRDDGVIFVQCDDNEQAYLKVLMDEVFGRENFVNNIIAVMNPRGRQEASYPIAKSHEYLIIYSKEESMAIFLNINKKEYTGNENIYRLLSLRKSGNASSRKDRPNMYYPIYYSEKYNDISIYKNEDYTIEILPIKTSDGSDGRWRWKKENVQANKHLLVVKKNSKGVYDVYEKNYTVVDGEYKGEKIQTFIKDKNIINDKAKEHLETLFGEKIFDYPKSEYLLKIILEISTQPNDIVLDYHLGSGTTAAVAHKMGRQYIGVEQMDYVETIACERLRKVIQGEQGGISKSVNWKGGGDFIYFELAKWNETAKEKILECESLEELKAFFDEMYERYFLNYNLKIKEFKGKVLQEENFRNLSLDEQKKIFVAMLDNNQMYVNKTEMADKKFGISEEDQNLTNQFYNKEE
ncbi:MAG: adenine-specific DNA-methyltransferase, partial [Rikenellaceae bacterium]|nr:adenine-specific DNA-methyltransferase [Rikenellaceae bacterium]